jgi:hypothetical protein
MIGVGQNRAVTPFTVYACIPGDFPVPKISVYLYTMYINCICRVGQNRIFTPYMTVYMVISLPKILYTHRIYMVLANPTYMAYKYEIYIQYTHGAGQLQR